MNRKTLAVALVVAALTAWWLFGFSTTTEGPFTERKYRFFGRVTRIDFESTNSTHRFRTRLIYPWGEPWTRGDPITSCAAIPPETWEDRNGDSIWDTWLYRVGPDRSGECSVEYRVDLTNDGRADWRFVSPFRNYAEAERLILTRRKF